MKRLILFIVVFWNTVIVFGQNNPETYMFVNDIYKGLKQDTTAWKNQSWATKFSFSGHYLDALKTFELDGISNPISDESDRSFFVKSKKIDAKEYILKQSFNAQIIIINEAHHIAKHRTFTKSLLKELYENGYRYIGFESLGDLEINNRKYPTLKSGSYTKEPEFGNLLVEAIEIGFTLFGYEAKEYIKDVKGREIEQAQNIKNFIDNNPDGKMLIYCGYDHAHENEHSYMGKAMAGRLKELTEIDPLTIDQTMFIEVSNEKYNHIFIQQNQSKAPIVLIDQNGKVFNGKKEMNPTDIVIIHPKTEYINNRPHWLMTGKEKYNIPSSKIKKHKKAMVLAYRENEFENDGVPADIIEISSDSSYTLYLKKGKYDIIIKDENYMIIDNYKIEIK